MELDPRLGPLVIAAFVNKRGTSFAADKITTPCHKSPPIIDFSYQSQSSIIDNTTNSNVILILEVFPLLAAFLLLEVFLLSET